MPINYATLASEIQNNTGGYGPFTDYVTGGNDQAIADILNFPRDGATVCPVNAVAGNAISVRNSAITGMAIRSVIDDRDLPASPTAAQLAILQIACGSGSIEMVDDAGADLPMLGNLKRLLQNPGPQGSRARVIALVNRTGSRAEKLFGPGTEISVADVARSLGRG
jgi:hypothetical protein